MDINNLQSFLDKTGRGEIAYGCCVTFADCAVTEVACAAGMDFVWIDGEHGEMDRLNAMHHMMAVKGLSRVDFFVRRHGAREEFLFNEINTMPGFTEISMYPKLMINEGMSYAGVIDNLIALAMGKEIEA